MQTDNERFMERISAVESKIRAYARFFAFRATFLDEDDLFQIAMLELLERYHKDPQFLSQNNSYIWCYASWMMKNALNHERALYANKIVDLEPEMCDTPLPIGYFPRPESETIKSEVRDLVREMPEQYRTIYDSLIEGFDSQEIGEMLGIGKWAYERRKKILIDKLGKAWRAPKSEREHIIREM